MKVNIYQKDYLHHLIPNFTEWITQSIKWGMCFYHVIFDTFFGRNLF